MGRNKAFPMSIGPAYDGQEQTKYPLQFLRWSLGDLNGVFFYVFPLWIHERQSILFTLSISTFCACIS
jgi:hypothetical protein